MYDYIERRNVDRPPAPGPEDGARSIVVRSVHWTRTGHWLVAALADLIACRARSLLFGLCYVGMGLVIVRAHEQHWSGSTGFVAAFLFLGPLLAVGTYELSRQRERGESSDLIVALFAWCRNPRELCLLAVLLCAILLLWFECARRLLSVAGPLSESALAIDEDATTHSVLLWWIALTLFSLLAFVSSVIAVPLLHDRAVSVVTAVRASMKCCLKNPLTMSVWAITVVTVIGSSLWLGLWPLLFGGPWIGHATWHVYRDFIDKPDSAGAGAIDRTQQGDTR